MTDDATPPDPAALVRLMPFAALLGLQLDAATPGEVRGRLAWAPERCTAGGLMHGGALMALADSLGGICAYLNLPRDARTATTNSSQRVPAPGALRDGDRRGPAAARRADHDRGADQPDRRGRAAGRPGHPDPGRAGRLGQPGG